MSNPNVEVFCILLVTILFLDYTSKIQVKNFHGRLGFYYLSSIIVGLSLFMLIGDLVQINHLLSFQFIKSILIVLPSLIIYYIIYNNITDNKYKKRSMIFITVFLFFYVIMTVLYYANVFQQEGVADYSFYYNIAYLAIIPPLILLYNLLKRIKGLKNISLLIVAAAMPIIFIILDIQLDKFVFITAGYTLSLLIIYINRMNLSLNFDPLTRVYNRYYFEKVIKDFKLKSNYLAVYYIDIDNFKQINDKYGHNEGDNVLKIVANILNSTIDYNADVFRVGGDEFVILRHIDNPKDAKEQIEIINLKLEEYKCRHCDYDISLSIGYEITGKAYKLEKIVENADEKMYKEKKLLKNKQ